MTRQEVLHRRLATHRLGLDKLSTAADVVRLLCCVQSQEYAHALWSLGMRTSDLSATEVQAEFDRGAFLRTHILRPTWHFVAAEDIRWILELTAPRVQKLNQGIYRQEGLDEATLQRGAALIAEELRGSRYRTRAELAQALAGRGLASERLRLAYIVMNAELEGLICSGPMRGAQQTYALLDERAPRSSAADAGGGRTRVAAELAYRSWWVMARPACRIWRVGPRSRSVDVAKRSMRSRIDWIVRPSKESTCGSTLGGQERSRRRQHCCSRCTTRSP
jgi:hypothetical protein